MQPGRVVARETRVVWPPEEVLDVVDVVVDEVEDEDPELELPDEPDDEPDAPAPEPLALPNNDPNPLVVVTV